MTLGKSLRLRRIFAQGRALIVDCGPCSEDPVAQVRLLARHGVDAIVITPGLLEVVADDLAGLAAILRIDGGMRLAQQLISVQAALEMGAEAVFLSVALRDGGPSDALDRFGRVTEDARRLGMPVFAEILGGNWLAAARLGADYGADVIQARFVRDPLGYRNFVRATGRPLVVALEEQDVQNADLLEVVYEAVQGAQGLALHPHTLAGPDPGPVLQAIHALVHQGVSAEEAAAIAWPGQAASANGEEK